MSVSRKNRDTKLNSIHSSLLGMHFAKIDDPRFKLYDLTVADDSVGRCRDLDLFSLLVTHLLKGVCISTELI